MRRSKRLLDQANAEAAVKRPKPLEIEAAAKLAESKTVALEPSACQGLDQHAFFKYWTQGSTATCQVIRVPRFCTEHAEVLARLDRDCSKMFTVTSVERIQNTQLWNTYRAYIQEQDLQNDQLTTSAQSLVQEHWAWHGSRSTKPVEIFTKEGFMVTKSTFLPQRIWFAIKSSYSMGSFAHRSPGNIDQVILALVAQNPLQPGAPDVQNLYRDEGSHRAWWALNCFKNEATYPAYVLTFKRLSSKKRQQLLGRQVVRRKQQQLKKKPAYR
jgi:hypothetical protein